VKPYYTDSTGRIVIYHGDALEIMPMLRAAAYRLVVTDPPYVIGGSERGEYRREVRWMGRHDE
jgi:DNA modification methylase